MGFSSPGTNILCDAAQDPDFYDFGTIAAHAQTPDAADLCGPDSTKRTAIINKAVEDYVQWVDARFQQCWAALEKENPRLSIYWLGYMLHSIEDLAVHIGITNGEHASTSDNPDFKSADVALSYVYARRALDVVRNALGQDGFDLLRNHDGDGKLGFFEKHRKEIHPKGWDIDDCLADYYAAGKRYKTIKPAPAPVRWDREVVLSQVIEKISTHRYAQMRKMYSSLRGRSANLHRRFEVLEPLTPRSEPAQWTILVYMAGDDRNPNGIEYAISQDLAEIKTVGSTNSVHFLVQTDDASGTASYRYRLRKGTDLSSDRIERFNGDLNTGSTKTLVDFVRWAGHFFPAKRYALVLWGHGSGHDDQNVYRVMRGSVSPRTAARLAQKRLGFFSGTRTSLLEQGPTRGYGYDDTAGDFLDNGELRKVLLQAREILGRKLDILGFDACLMAMIEVAYQTHDLASVLVASERTEPGDGWSYRNAFRGLPSSPEMPTARLVKDLVDSYRKAYKNEMTLSAVDLEKVPLLARCLDAWAKAADPGDFHRVRRTALDCSPRPGDGYCDLGSFLDSASDGGHKGFAEARKARKILRQAVIASCGRTSGLTIYVPGNFRPEQAGSTDALYLGLNFVRETEWGKFLRRVYPLVKNPAPGVEALAIPTPLTGLDRFNARHILAAVLSGEKESWVDRLRGEVLRPCRDVATDALEQINRIDPPLQLLKSQTGLKEEKRLHEQRRILILPGIMGSLLHDRSGKLGTVWIDPCNIVFGDDFDALKLKWGTEKSIAERLKIGMEPVPLPLRIQDADDAVQIEACGVIPIIYDRMALALMHEFGPIVEFAPYDWRQPISYLGKGLAARIEALAKDYPAIQIALVAHSMGGLVAADAMKRLEAGKSSALGSIKSFVVLGTPFLGSANALRALRAERGDLQLLELLGRKSAGEIENVVQTFRGLFDLMPGDQDELLKPAVFAPGPLSRLSPEDARLDLPHSIEREIPPSILERSQAIFCTKKSTLGRVAIREDGSMDYSETVGGDGTVTTRSALNADQLLSRGKEVDEGHRTLPLDGKAIHHTIDWIARKFGPAPKRSSSRIWPAAPEISLPASRAELIRHLEADDGLTLGDFVALLSLA
jgi:pimeloyl-ACP methyl ester carboxylesterase